MEQITLVGRRSMARDVLKTLQQLGAVQIDRLANEAGVEELQASGEPSSADLERWSEQLAHLTFLRDTLQRSGVTPAPRSEVPQDLEEVERLVHGLRTQVDALVAERAELRDEVETIEAYLPLFRLLAPMLAPIEGSRWLSGFAFLVPSDTADSVRAELEDALEDRVQLSSRVFAGQQAVVMVVLKRDDDAARGALSRLGLSPLQLPDRFASDDTARAVHTMEERSQQLPGRLSEIQTELDTLASEQAPSVLALHIMATNVVNRLERLNDLATGRYAFAMKGWVPAAESTKVLQALSTQYGDDVVVSVRPADSHHDEHVPVQLQNPRWMRPFQGLLALFAPPKYGNFDPTWTLAIFFPLFFGVVVGDIAYGLIFLSVGLWLIRRGRGGRNLNLGPLGIIIPAHNLPGIGTVINWAASWSIVFGFIYGEFWGNFLEKWPVNTTRLFYPEPKPPLENGQPHHLIDIPLFRGGDGVNNAEQLNTLLLITIGFGMLQVLLGWGIRAYYGWKHHDTKHMWEGVGMFSGLVAVFVFATAYLTNTLGAAALAVSGVLFAVFLLGVVLSRVPLMLVELISNSGNVLSYLRLFAVGLSAALVANLGTAAGFALNGAVTIPVLGEVLGVLVAVFINMFAVILTLVGHTLQPLRLQYVEFFTKFGFYEESGRTYRPFRLHGGKA
jgi:V/A-type H+-transporting ATPase subunit I